MWAGAGSRNRKDIERVPIRISAWLHDGAEAWEERQRRLKAIDKSVAWPKELEHRPWR